MPHDECPMAIALKEGRIVRGAEVLIERSDGTRLWCTPYPTPMRDAAGRIVGGINMLVDITGAQTGRTAAATPYERAKSSGEKHLGDRSVDCCAITERSFRP